MSKNLSTAACKHGVIDQGKYKKQASKWNCIEREYHVHNDADVAQIYMKMFCNTNHFPSFPFCGLHKKSHGVRGLSKQNHIRFDLKLGHEICAMPRINFACAECTSMLDKPWINGLTPKQQPRYRPVTNWSYWPVLDSFNNWNIPTLSHKSTESEAFEEICQFDLDGISENMASLVKYGKYGAINTTDT